MVNEGNGIPTKALEDLAYLSRSANRVAILDALTKGAYTRRELEERTGVSRTTLDRIVNELEGRGWAERANNGTYVATSTGNHLMAQVRPFVDSVEAIRRLDEAVAWLPDDEMSIGLHHFSDAIVRQPEEDDPMKTTDYFIDLIRDTAEFRALTHLAPPVSLSRAMRDRIVTEQVSAEYVLTDTVVNYLSDNHERRSRWRDMIESGADVYRDQGPIPCNLWIFDDIVLIKKSGPESIQESYGVPIESENVAVRSWAHDLIDRCRADAVRVDAETLAGESSVRRSDSDML